MPHWFYNVDVRSTMYHPAPTPQLEKSRIRLATRHFFNSLFYYKKIIYTILQQITKIVQDKKAVLQLMNFLTIDNNYKNKNFQLIECNFAFLSFFSWFGIFVNHMNFMQLKKT